MNDVVNLDINTQTDPTLVGAREASAEEQELLDSVMDTMEQAIHGDFREDVVNVLDSHPDLWQTSSQVTSMLVSRMAHKLDEEQIPYDSSLFFGQNGVIQQTTQMVWEVAEAINHPSADDDAQFEASYMSTLKNIGENMVDDDESAKEAQAFLLQQELGEDVVGMAAEEMEREAIALQEAEGDGSAPVLGDIL